MRLARLDHLPGGRSIELHPRLTVLHGAPADVRERLAEVLRSIVSGEPVPYDGQAELHGILVSLRDRAFDLSSGAGVVDPVLDLSAPGPLRPVGGSNRRRSAPGPDEAPAGRRRVDGPVVEMRSTEDPSPIDAFSATSGPRRTDDPALRDPTLLDPTGAPAAGGPPDAAPGGVDDRTPPVGVGSTSAPRPSTDPDPAIHTRRIANDDLVRLRAELRSLDGERTVLARATEEARADLDSFARATLDVAVRQLDSVQARRDAAEADRAGWLSEHGGRRDELAQRIDLLRAELDALPVGGADMVAETLDRLIVLSEPSTVPDPEAQVLAAELEDLRRSMEGLEARRMAVEGFLADAEEQLAEAERELQAARSSIRSPELHPAVVRQLESVRDEIFELEERGGRVAAVRNRRRIDELRSEEALLLDQLGFDTYTAFVMGTPNRETEAGRAMREDRARARVDQLTDEVRRLREELPGGAEDRWNRTERDRIVAAAAELLGSTPDGLGRLTTPELVDLLGSQVERPTPQASADLLAASGRLAAALVAAGAPAPDSAADPAAMRDLAERWLSEERDRVRRRDEIGRTLEDLERELEQLDEASRRADDGGRLADLDAELRTLRARIAEGEAAVERHERATLELADLRAQELELRDRERDLLVRISDRERLLHVLGADSSSPVPPPTDLVPPPVDPADPSVPATPSLPPVPRAAPTPDRRRVPRAHESEPVSAANAEALRRVVDRDASVAWPVDREWQLLARLGEVRSVGPAGAVPLLVGGIDAASVDTPALLHRITSMSELVQSVVVTDDERLCRWAEGLGPDAHLIRW